MRGPRLWTVSAERARRAFITRVITETASLPLAALPLSRFEGGDWTFERAPTTLSPRCNGPSLSLTHCG